MNVSCDFNSDTLIFEVTSKDDLIILYIVSTASTRTFFEDTYVNFSILNIR